MLEVEGTKRTRQEQDQAIANLITEVYTLIKAVQDDAVVAVAVQAFGYDDARLEDGMVLQRAALSKFAARAEAIGAQRQATIALEAAETAARDVYATFRLVARAMYRDSDARSALSMKGVVPQDRQKFITTAAASYANAQADPFATEFALYGYSVDRIAAVAAALDDLVASDTRQNTAISDAIAATAARDAAARELTEWMGKFRSIIKAALKDDPQRLSVLMI